MVAKNRNLFYHGFGSGWWISNNWTCIALSGKNVREIDIKKGTPTLAFKKTCATPSEKAN